MSYSSLIVNSGHQLCLSEVYWRLSLWEFKLWESHRIYGKAKTQAWRRQHLGALVVQGPMPVLSSVETLGLQCSLLFASLLAFSPSVLNDSAKVLDSRKRVGSLRSCCCALARKRWSLQNGIQWEKSCSQREQCFFQRRGHNNKTSDLLCTYLRCNHIWVSGFAGKHCSPLFHSIFTIS